MDRNRVILLWITLLRVCVVQSQDTVIDVTDTTTLPFETPTPDDDTQEVEQCEWDVRGTTSLCVSWSGNASADSVVGVEAQQLSLGTAYCKNGSVRIERVFVKGSVDLPVCSNTQYKISIEFDCSTSENSRTVWSPPESPQNIAFENITNTSFVVFWDRPSGNGPIEIYTVSVSFGKDDHRFLNSSEEKAEISGLEPYTVYQVGIAAKNPDFWSDSSEKKALKTKVGIPPIPRNLRQTAVGNTSISLTWEAPSSSKGPILKYRVRWWNGSDSREVDTLSNDTASTVAPLTPFVLYTFRVAAESEAGVGQWSDELTLRTSIGMPHPPENVTATSVTNTSVSLRWDPPTVSTGPILEYRIHWENATFATENATHATIRHLMPYVAYTFKVLAVTEAGPGSWSNETTVRTAIGVPYAPKNLREVAVTNTSVRLTWNPPSETTGPILVYRIQWRNASASGRVDTSSNDTFYTIERLVPFVHYTFQVSALTQAGSGPPSEERNVRTHVGVPHAPRNVSIARVTNTTIELKWKEPAVPTGPILKYRIQWTNSSGVGQEDTKSATTGYTVHHLTPYVDYVFRVLALTSAGPGKWSSEVKERTQVGVPHAPRNVSIARVTNTTIELTWKEPAVSTGPILKYRIQWRNSSGVGEEDSKSATAGYTVHHLTPYVDYVFRVLALTSAGPGKWSREMKERTQVGVPHAPKNVSIARVTNTTIELTWKEPTVSTGPILRYRIQWRNASGVGEEDSKSATTLYTFHHLTPYVEYIFKVLALTSAGPGKWSREMKERTQVGVPHAPRNVSIASVTNTTIELTWKEPAVSTGPILKYRIQWRNASGVGEEDSKSAITLYTFHHLTPYVDYLFRVLALTSAGPGKWSSEVKGRTQVGVPHAPRNVSIARVTNTTIELTWKEPAVSTGPILKYRIQWRNSSSVGEEDSKSATTLYTFHHLTPYVDYVFRVLALTSAGPGKWSSEVKRRTQVGVPSVPEKLHAEHVTNTSLSLRWDPPEFPSAPFLNYTLMYRLLLRDDVDATRETIGEFAGVETVRYVIEDLLPYSYYSIRVFASSSAGFGNATKELIEQTAVGVPLPAEISDVKAPRRRTVIVRWKTPGPYPGPVDYTLETTKISGPCSVTDKEQVSKVLKGIQRAEEWRSQHQTVVGDLSPFGEYRFKIVLMTSAKDGVVSSRMSDTIRIPPEASSAPLDFRAECTGSPTELNLTWKPPAEPNGLITSYRIQYGLQRLNASRLVYTHNMCQSQSYVLKGLRPEKRYAISVSARVENVSEDGKPAHPERVCLLPPGIPFLGDTSRLQATGSTSDSLELEWSKDTFSEDMGAIVHYAVLVGRRNTLGNATSGKSATVGPPWAHFSSGVSRFYQATPPGWNPFQDDVFDPLECQTLHRIDDSGSNGTLLRCTVGLDKNCPRNETYCNGPLEPDTPYEVKIRAFTRGGFAETDLLYARSRPVPKPDVAGKVIAVLFAVFLVMALTGGFYFAKKKGHLDNFIAFIQSRLNAKETPPVTEDPPIPMEECLSPKPVKIQCFAEHVRIMMSDSHLKFSLEFEKLKNESPKLPCTVAEMEDNRSKNRWMNIFPFDHSRVKLLPLCDDPCSDFINANYIPGYSSRREYIATQGPLPQVLDDFWRMVWEQSVSMIVMLTQCVERGKKKCEKYWPDSGETVYYADLRVTTVSVSMLSSYIIRIFHVQSGSYERLVKQMHFTHWPDFGCPESPADLINFVNAVREHLPRVEPGPILVHCSAGVGRTGTFIALDRLMLQLLHSTEDTVDVYGTVLDLRQHRTNMVQTEDQYIYIHLCVRQLIEERERPLLTDSEENIYSNGTFQSGFVRFTAQERPLQPRMPRDVSKEI